MAFFGKNKKDKELKVLMPINGEVVNLDTVPDPVFAQKMMGDGFAIVPSEGKIYAPFDGTILTLFPTGHAVGIGNSIVEVLIHFGLDTVTLNGEGFTAHVKQGDKVKAGDLLIEVDIDNVKPKVPSIVTPVVFTKIEDPKYKIAYGQHNVGDVITNIDL